MLKRVIIAATLAVSVPAQASAESWLCIPDMSAGFSFNKASQSWQHTKFNIQDERLIIRVSNTASRKYEVNVFGKETSMPDYICKEGPNESGFLFCQGIFGEFKFNTENLRYIRVYMAGYIEMRQSSLFMKEGDDTPHIEIGKCSKI